jgi:trigger factor
MGQWARELEVEVEASRVEKEIDKALRKYQRQMEIPGFRKGKVPLKVVKSRFGESIRGEVIGDLLPVLLEEATREAGLVPAAPPQIAKIDHEPGGDLTFTAALDIWPEIEADNYEDLDATRMVHEVADEEIDEQLEELRRRQATEQAVERPLEKGDVLIADLQRLDENGVAVVGERFEERYFHIGDENAPSPEFEEGLVGMSTGEERKISFAYREDLPNEELAGKTEHFDVTAREVRERALPDLDDEFAKDVGEQFQTMADLREHITSQIQERWGYMADQRLRSDLIGQLIEKNEFELPESMVENYLNSMKREQQAQGQTHDQDHDHDHDHDQSKHTDEEREQAVRRLKSFLLIESVRKQAKVEVADAEFDQFAAERAEQAGSKLEDLQRSGKMDDLRRELEEKKVFDLLGEKAKIKEEKV